MTKILQNIKPYNEKEFKAKFADTPLCKKLQQDFDRLIWNSQCNDFEEGTPRQHWGDRNLLQTKFSVVPFYYLEFLTEKNPKVIYDLGCGWNIFKKYIPSIIGIGAENPNDKFFFADVHDYVDDDFIKGHQNFFKSVFSICALHFVPMSNLRQTVLDFASMIKPGGRGFISLNAMRMLERDTKMISHPDLTTWIRSELFDLPFNILQFEVDLEKLDNGMDGNIRIVLEK